MTVTDPPAPHVTRFYRADMSDFFKPGHTHRISGVGDTPVWFSAAMAVHASRAGAHVLFVDYAADSFATRARLRSFKEGVTETAPLVLAPQDFPRSGVEARKFDLVFLVNPAVGMRILELDPTHIYDVRVFMKEVLRSLPGGLPQFGPRGEIAVICVESTETQEDGDEADSDASQTMCFDHDVEYRLVWEEREDLESEEEREMYTNLLEPPNRLHLRADRDPDDYYGWVPLHSYVDLHWSGETPGGMHMYVCPDDPKATHSEKWRLMNAAREAAGADMDSYEEYHKKYVLDAPMVLWSPEKPFKPFTGESA
ncbi:hypothetical protein [Streptomyces subrutilus]|uniref:Uncharacterized protein n=1 Tax=Streptomyces subrutilus TaxID=36818 RepID=A0A1E5PXH0_9ACTN|nr:hypothetical protein [Streptomyces subrutilus]OEJ34170.1 hypothetical protein BGK67_25070 [Streptomyces subrutilus]